MRRLEFLEDPNTNIDREDTLEETMRAAEEDHCALQSAKDLIKNIIIELGKVSRLCLDEDLVSTSFIKRDQSSYQQSDCVRVRASGCVLRLANESSGK